MSPESKSTNVFKSKIGERIWRPLAVVLCTGAIGVGIHQDSKNIQAEGYVLQVPTLDKYPSSNFEANLRQLSIEIEGPVNPKDNLVLSKAIELRAGEEFNIGLLNARKEAERQSQAKEAQVVPYEPPAINAQTEPSSVSGVGNEMLITGYYCKYDSGYYGDGGGFCGHMANGENTHDGAGACGPGIPLGTKFDIEGYGVVTCEDHGSAVGNNHIDVFTYFSSGLSSIPTGMQKVTEVK